MIIGIGVDIIEIKRIEDAILKNQLFINKIFTKREVEDLKVKNFKSESIAGRFAAKEAVSKALGLGFRGFSFRDIEVCNDSLGKPLVLLIGKARDIAENIAINGYNIHVSISHDRQSAIAYAIFENK